jgi:hypothetical protein
MLTKKNRAQRTKANGHSRQMLEQPLHGSMTLWSAQGNCLLFILREQHQTFHTHPIIGTFKNTTRSPGTTNRLTSVETTRTA